MGRGDKDLPHPGTDEGPGARARRGPRRLWGQARKASHALLIRRLWSIVKLSMQKSSV